MSSTLRKLRFKLRQQSAFLANRARGNMNPAFIHIPKTGGTYLSQQESDSHPVIWPVKYLGHWYVAAGKDAINPIYIPNNQHIDRTVHPSTLRNFFVFATVRNHYDWLVSYYYHAGGFNPRYRDTGHYDYDLAQRGFDYFVKAIAERTDSWPSNRFLFLQIFDDAGNVVPDYICRTHTLDQDIGRVAELCGVTYAPRERHRVGRRSQEEKDYRNFYDDSLRELVRNTWCREMDLYGFSFDPKSEPEATLPRDCGHQKGRVRYSWKENILWIDGVAQSCS